MIKRTFKVYRYDIKYQSEQDDKFYQAYFYRKVKYNPQELREHINYIYPVKKNTNVTINVSLVELTVEMSDQTFIDYADFKIPNVAKQPENIEKEEIKK